MEEPEKKASWEGGAAGGAEGLRGGALWAVPSYMADPLCLPWNRILKLWGHLMEAQSLSFLYYQMSMLITLRMGGEAP